MTALEALQRAPLFEGFSATGLKVFAAIAVERTLEAGSRLFAEGEAGEAMYVVKSGALRLVQRGEKGERQVGTVGPGDHVGALALLAPDVRLVTASAAVATEVVELGRRAFFKVAQEKPQACLKLALLIAADLARRVGENRTALSEALSRAAEKQH